MNLFENELRKLFDGTAVFENAVFVGRLCFGDVGKDLRARVEFTCPDKFNHFSAIKVTILNRASGAVDCAEIAFRDIWGVELRQGIGWMNDKAPYVWVHDNKARWLPDAPGQEDYDCLRRAVGDYVYIFRSQQERNERASLQDKIRIAAICVMDSGVEHNNMAKGFDTVR